MTFVVIGTLRVKILTVVIKLLDINIPSNKRKASASPTLHVRPLSLNESRS